VVKEVVRHLADADGGALLGLVTSGLQWSLENLQVCLSAVSVPSCLLFCCCQSAE
jgi:hypothetical protein